MPRKTRAAVWLHALFFALGCVTSCYCIAQEINQQICEPSTCGDMLNISYPFRLKGHPSSSNCGHPDFELDCHNNRTILHLNHSNYYYYVREINYSTSTIRIVDPGLKKGGYCFSPPLHSFTYENSIYPYVLLYPYYSVTVLMNCKDPISHHNYVPLIPCDMNGSSSSSSSSIQTNSYAFVGDLSVRDLQPSCTIGVTVPTQFEDFSNGISNASDLQDVLLMGIELSFREYRPSRFKLFLEYTGVIIFNIIYDVIFGTKYEDGIDKIIFQGTTVIGRAIIGERIAVGICLFAVIIYKFRRRHLSMDDNIEEFLQRQNNLMPIRYSYSQIKQITKNFKDKLGQGGYGSVFKGKLRSGLLVAIKVLGKSTANGQEFINEISTIGRIHHVHVVKLIGFCVEGSKRALIYEFMPNGSLEKYLSPKDEKHIPLSWEKKYEISVGVARGIEYLHRGCDVQILHFDIKPSNILLDENFVPKVSDFGLAKLYPVDDSMVSLTRACGTVGYIAPEVFYNNFGKVSYKADVYSFGMLLMEMVGIKDNKASSETSSKYFPSWIYDQFHNGQDIEMGDASEDERKIARKMTIVALWCILMNPVDRPSMIKVLEMLEGDVELLQLPSETNQLPQDTSLGEKTCDENSTASSFLCSSSSTDSITLDVIAD